MALSGFFALLDDIASVLDDVAAMTKVATKKTAGVLGDDLALNAQQVSGVQASRELPVVWAVAKGSLLNKAILVPLALVISAWIPWLVVPLMVLGGCYLCFEGVEKFFHKKSSSEDDHISHLKLPNEELLKREQSKIKGAIRTDFILSAEIVIITLGTVADSSFSTRLAVLSGISLLMTVGVYGLVAGIVKLDDLGFYLSQVKISSTKLKFLVRSLSRGILAFAPKLMKSLSILGTVAMFLVGGGIVTHAFPSIHHWIAHTSENFGPLSSLGEILGQGIVGLVSGLLCYLGFLALNKGLSAARN